MSKRQLGVQLYSLRAAAVKDFVKVLKDVANAGYKVVEPAGFHDLSPKEFKKVIDDLGLKVVSSHSPWITPDNVRECVDAAHAIGAEYLICGYGPDDFKTLDTIKNAAERTNRMLEQMAGSGIKLAQHNHDFEFQRLDGRLKYDYYFDECPDIQLELDTYWCANFGAEDPAAMVKYYADRLALLHIKDGNLIPGDYKFVAVGTGKIDVPAVIAAAPAQVSTMIVEMDDCATDMLEALTAGRRYLVDNKLV